MNKEDIQISIFGIVGIIMIYCLMMALQHFSGACKDWGGDYWAGGCHLYQRSGETGIHKR